MGTASVPIFSDVSFSSPFGAFPGSNLLYHFQTAVSPWPYSHTRKNRWTFDFNRAINIRLRDSLQKDLVCPFHYFGIKDVDGIDYSTLKHSPEDGEEYLNEVSTMLMKSKRVDYILEKIRFYRHDGDKTKCLGFCATVEHAEFMATSFNSLLGDGTAIALSGKNSVTQRQKYLQDLENDNTKLQYIFSRDIFNEGIDVQNINLILMLRPTQSSIVFTQQLGRGLRKNKGKEFLTVLDFIGNYQRSFLISSVFSKEPNPDKKTRLREVSSDFSKRTDIKTN